MSNQDHVEVALNRVRVIFEKASDRIEALKPKERIPATQLAVELAAELKTDGGGPALYQVLKYLFKDYPDVKITRGAKGGIEKLEVANPNTPLTNIGMAVAKEQGIEIIDIKASPLSFEDLVGNPSV